MEDYHLERIGAVIEFSNTLEKESDRGCALIVAAFLDYELKEMLAKYLVDDQNEIKIILNQSGALATFSSRISLAYLLGLISERSKKDLNLIRKIRNDFGHLHDVISFKTPSVSSRCMELAYSEFENFSKDDAREVFIFSARGIMFEIHTALYQKKRLSFDAELAAVTQRKAIEQIQLEKERLLEIIKSKSKTAG